MDELETQLNNITEPAQAEEQAVEAPENKEQVQPEAAQAAAEGEPQELWKKTKQFEQGLWKSPDDVYNSVKYYEQKYMPLEQAIKRMGFNAPEELEQAFKEYQEKLPTYQENEQAVNLINALLQDETYGAKLRNTFDEIRRAQEMAKWGISFDQLPAAIRERVEKGERAFQELEEMKQKEAYTTALNTVNEQVALIEKIAQEYGYDVNIQEILEHCRDNGINPANIYGEFLKNSFADLVDKAKQNASFATTQQNKQNKAHAVNSSTKQGAQNAPKTPNTSKELEQEILNLL